jgi:nucleobase:cation symporter-1, NCS1 family
MAADFWIVKKRRIDIPSLYRRRGRYRYHGGVNWRAAVAFLISIGPNLPGMAHAVTPSIMVGSIEDIYDISFMWGFSSGLVVYSALNYFWPASETLIESTIRDEITFVNGIEVFNDGLETPLEKAPDVKSLEAETSSV